MKTRLCKILIIPLVLVIYYLAVRKLGFGIPCLFHALTGLNCPGCGLSRMLIALSKLDLKAAFSANMAVFLLLPLILYLLIKAAVCYVAGYRPEGRALKTDRILSVALIALLLIWGAVRNIFHV